MNNTMKGLLIFIFCTSLLMGMPTGVSAENLTLASAIEKGGLQRMLIQRIGKAYCQIGIGVYTQASREQLSQAVEMFDTQLNELEAFAPTPQIKEALLQVRQLWGPVKTVATGEVTKEGAKKVAYWNDDLLHASHKVVQLLQDTSNTSYARLVNLSGRQRMLSQRLAKFYMLKVWGFDTLTIADEVENAKNDFTGALETLRAATENTEAISRQLDAVYRDWTWFQKALNMKDTDFFPQLVADVSESILVSMDDITKKYEELADKILVRETPAKANAKASEKKNQ